MSHGSWKEYYDDPDIWFGENAASLDMINLLASGDTETCIQNLQNWPVLVVLTVDASSDELVMFHHITRVGLSMKKKTSTKTERIVALNGFLDVASVVRFRPADKTFDSTYVVEVVVPDDLELEGIADASAFRALKPKPGNKKLFHSLLILPPFIVLAFLSASSLDPALLAQHIVVADQSLKERFKDLDDFEADNHKAAVLYVLEWSLYPVMQALLLPRYTISVCSLLCFILKLKLLRISNSSLLLDQ